MKFLVSILLTALLSIATCLFLPWWSIAIVAFIVAAAIPQHWGKSFLTGFIALFLLWGSFTWILSGNNDHILAHKISLLILNTESVVALIAITALIGGLVAGFGALAGSFVRRRAA